MSRAGTAEALRRAYLGIDARSLALGRMAMAVVLIADLLRRVPWLRDFYSNEGLLPNHTVLWRPPVRRMFSVFFMASLPEEAGIWFAIAGVCFFCLLIGWKTRLFHVLSFALATSLHSRILYAENWGAVAVGVLLLWTLFLPLGQRFSVDAVLVSLRARPNETPQQLAAGAPPPDTRQATSLAALGLLLQIAVIYWLSFLQEDGVTWRDGTALHYVLHQERMVTQLGLWAREHLPFSWIAAATHATLAIQAAAAPLILTPVFWRWTRAFAAALLTAMHAAIAATVDLGIFSLAMLAFQPFLLTEAQWTAAARRVPRRGRARTVFYDADCGFCWMAVRVLARLDVHRRLLWLPNTQTPALPAAVDLPSLERTILVVDPATDRRWTRSDAFAEIFRALPLGGWWSWPLRLPGLRGVACRAYDAIAARRTRISIWLGLAACGALSSAGRVSAASEVEDVTPPRGWSRSRLPVLREIGVALVFLVLAANLSVNNRAIPPALRLARQPTWMAAAVSYAHVVEGWSLFGPDAPRTDETIYVDAVTREGRRVDPFNELGSRTAALPVEAVPVRLGQPSFWSDYALHIPGTVAYHQAFLEWILRYPDRTRRPGDEIARFDAYVVEQDSPRPGDSQPTHVQRRRFFHWP
jgi:predicted DCC family thiol-disulfide oxidoreductase YuxK